MKQTARCAVAALAVLLLFVTLPGAVSAEKGLLQDNSLHLTDSWFRQFEGERPALYEKEQDLVLSDVEDTKFFFKDWKEPDQMNYGELSEYIQEIEEKDLPQ